VKPILYRFVTGYDFSRADKANRTGVGFSPCGTYFAIPLLSPRLFPQPVQPVRKAANLEVGFSP
jgi:hypothetical protein